MLELLDFDRVHEIVILIVPGFVSLRVWTLIYPTARLRLSHYVLDVVVYSVLNFAAQSWLIVIVEDRALLIRVLTWAVVLVIACSGGLAIVAAGVTTTQISEGTNRTSDTVGVGPFLWKGPPLFRPCSSEERQPHRRAVFERFLCFFLP